MSALANSQTPTQPLVPCKQDREKIGRIGMRKLMDQVKGRKIVLITVAGKTALTSVN